jgi:hypothetical protein
MPKKKKPAKKRAAKKAPEKAPTKRPRKANGAQLVDRAHKAIMRAIDKVDGSHRRDVEKLRRAVDHLHDNTKGGPRA